MADLLIEIGTEEIPAGYIAPALEQFSNLLHDALGENRLDCGEIETAATPRRLVVFAHNVPERQPDVTEEVQGPPARIAYDADGNLTKAALGFAKKQGIEPSALERRETDKGGYAYATLELPGAPATEVIAQLLPGIVAAIPSPKSMRWVADGITFARPIRTLLVLLGADVIDVQINGVKSGRLTKGHPFLSPGDIEVPAADFAAFRKTLAGHHVILDIDERRQIIREKIEAKLAEYGSTLEKQYEPLLDEVTQLVEWPNIVEGTFAQSHIDILPDEVTIAAMTGHQRYFPVRDADGKLLAKFITVSNRLDEYAGSIRAGNERVLAARLADAEFFWHEDSSKPLADNIEQLKGVVFQEKLGTYFDKTQRMMKLAEHIGTMMGLDARLCIEAARLSKADLVTNMVKEFPKLQGVMGREYARHEGLDAGLDAALAEHYQPRGADDSLPESALGACIALADKIDSLVGCFCAGLAPTGSRDPYALRRHTLGILRICLEAEQARAVDIVRTINFAMRLLPDGLPEINGAEGRVLDFVKERLRGYMIDREHRYDLIDAVLATRFTDLQDFCIRLAEIEAMSTNARWVELVELVQRTANILKKDSPDGQVSADLFEQDEEKAVWQAMQSYDSAPLADLALQASGGASAGYLDSFGEPVHAFFDKVFVNVDDAAVKKNRLLLMKRINELYTTNIADLSKVVLDEQG